MSSKPYYTAQRIPATQFFCELSDGKLKKHIFDFLTSMHKDFKVNVALQLMGDGIEKEVEGFNPSDLKLNQTCMITTQVIAPLKNFITLIPDSKLKTAGIVLEEDNLQ